MRNETARIYRDAERHLLADMAPEIPTPRECRKEYRAAATAFGVACAIAQGWTRSRAVARALGRLDVARRAYLAALLTHGEGTTPDTLCRACGAVNDGGRGKAGDRGRRCIDCRLLSPAEVRQVHARRAARARAA